MNKFDVIPIGERNFVDVLDLLCFGLCRWFKFYVE